MPPHRHRAGSLKQQNKAHRGVNGHHASKRALKRTQGGKVERVGGGGPGATAGRGHEGGVGALSAGSKLKRVTLSKQARKQKKADQLMGRRTGTKHGAPTTVLLLPMSRSADVGSLAAAFAAASFGFAAAFAAALASLLEDSRLWWDLSASGRELALCLSVTHQQRALNAQISQLS